jgi:hypothetical protein
VTYTSPNNIVTYDIAGNRTQEQVTIGMTTTTTHWTYNNANQISTMQIGSNPITHFTYSAVLQSETVDNSRWGCPSA